MNTSKIALYGNPDELYKLSAPETIAILFEHTDENGTLYIPEWPYDTDCLADENLFYKCVMKWNAEDVELVTEEYNKLYSALKQLAEKQAKDASFAAVDELPENLKEVWNTYIRAVEVGDFDQEQYEEIAEKRNIIAHVQKIREKMDTQKELLATEHLVYREHKDDTLSEEEKTIYDGYKDLVFADAEKRVGKGLAAYDVVIRAKRVCYLLWLEAPKIVTENEARLLAQAMVIHAYGVSIETVDEVE